MPVYCDIVYQCTFTLNTLLEKCEKKPYSLLLSTQTFAAPCTDDELITTEPPSACHTTVGSLQINIKINLNILCFPCFSPTLKVNMMLYRHLCVFMYVCVCVCVYIYIYIHMYTYIHILNLMFL